MYDDSHEHTPKKNWFEMSSEERQAFKDEVGIVETPTGFTLGAPTPTPTPNAPVTKQWLVEELTDTFEGYQMPFRAVIGAESARMAFSGAITYYPDRYWAFSPEDLEETIPGVLWEAADGSTMMYQVRLIPTTAVIDR